MSPTFRCWHLGESLHGEIRSMSVTPANTHWDQTRKHTQLFNNLHSNSPFNPTVGHLRVFGGMEKWKERGKRFSERIVWSNVSITQINCFVAANEKKNAHNWAFNLCSYTLEWNSLSYLLVLRLWLIFKKKCSTLLLEVQHCTHFLSISIAVEILRTKTIRFSPLFAVISTSNNKSLPDKTVLSHTRKRKMLN